MLGYKRQKLYIDTLQDQISQLNRAFNTLCQKTQNGSLSLDYPLNEINRVDPTEEESIEKLNSYLGIDTRLKIPGLKSNNSNDVLD